MTRPRTTARETLGILFFGEDWGRHNSTGQYLARELARRHPVLWVDSLGLRTPRLNLTDLARIAGKLARFSRRNTRPMAAGSALDVVTPLAIPFYRSRLVRHVNRLLLARQLAQARRRAGLVRWVVITACPATADIVGRLGAEAVAYYCADEYAEQPGLDAALVRRLEHQLLEHVDVVVASALRLAERKAQLHGNVCYLPHGVHYGHFRRAVDGALPCPDDLATVPRPRLGYVGLLGEHVDFAALTRLARELPEAQLVLIGPVEDACASRLPQGANVHYLGPRPHESLPAYLAHFDVCLLPWLNNARNRNANPTKLREYLAAGCPVVTTPVEEAAPLAHLIRTAADAAAFVAETRAALAEGDPARRRARSDAMGDADWSQRAAELWGFIEAARRRRVAAPRTATAVLRQGG
ncbi:MAG: glycosyltransferase [Gammaproteobacteria bacterium]|nr:glycosyltransferase [Gammaproteobacteria bacterium]